MKSVRSQEKLPWIDQLKGIGILAVVVGHMTTPLSRFIYSWHIPLFFFASGLLINRGRTLKISVTRDFLKLIVPFFIFTIFGLTLEYFKRWLIPGFPFVHGDINLTQELIGIFWWMDYSHLHQYGFVLWFLPALFWAKNIFLFLIKTIKNQYFVTLLCLGILSLVSIQPVTLPFCLDKALLGLFWLSAYWLLTGHMWLVGLLSLVFLPQPFTNIAVGILDWYGLVYSLIAINTIVGITKTYSKYLGCLSLFGRETVFVLIAHPYINNLSYLMMIIIFGGNWIVEVLLALLLLYLLTPSFISIRMVWRYTVQNNVWWQIPLVLFRSAAVISFQSLTRLTLTKNLGKGRRILLFPGSVVSRMFLYASTPDKDEIALLRKNIDQNSIFLDIGANIGSYSVLISDLTKNIFAFEPSPTSFDYCKQNFSLNGIKKNNVEKIALSDRAGVIGFTDYGGSSTTNHIENGSSSKIKVKTTTLDIWTKKSLTRSGFNLVMKIDVEGNEEGVLRGARLLFKNKKIKYMIIEIFDLKSEVFEIIKSSGYRYGKVSQNNYYVKKI